MARVGSKPVATDRSSTPPKLCLYSLPSQRPEPPGMATPPLRVPVSVPFSWEEAPGKPRKEPGPRDPRPGPSPGWRRGLDLPPRMVAEEMRGSSASSATALDGPYVLGRATSGYSFFSGEENPVRSKERGVWFWRRGRGRKVMRRDRNWEVSFRGLRGFISPSLSSSSQSSADSSGGDGAGNDDDDDDDEAKHDRKVRITRFRRTRSLANFSSHATSHLWAGIYGSLKQFVPWRKEREP